MLLGVVIICNNKTCNTKTTDRITITTKIRTKIICKTNNTRIIIIITIITIIIWVINTKGTLEWIIKTTNLTITTCRINNYINKIVLTNNNSMEIIIGEVFKETTKWDTNTNNNRRKYVYY